MITIKAHAKLNLSLHIDAHRGVSGYFPTHFINCQLSLYDLIEIEILDNELEFYCDNADVGPLLDNLAYKAAVLFKSQRHQEGLGARIYLKKHIPIKAGLGGGSADAAAVVLGLAKLWGIQLNSKIIQFLSSHLGQDFFYSLHGGLLELISFEKNYESVPLPNRLPQIWVVIVVPDEKKPSTAWSYQQLNLKHIGKNTQKIIEFKKHLLSNEPIDILNTLYNDFERDIAFYFPVVHQIKHNLISLGAKTSIMAGAGLSVVGFFNEKNLAEEALKQVQIRYRKTFIATII